MSNAEGDTGGRERRRGEQSAHTNPRVVAQV